MQDHRLVRSAAAGKPWTANY